MRNEVVTVQLRLQFAEEETRFDWRRIVVVENDAV